MEEGDKKYNLTRCVLFAGSGSALIDVGRRILEITFIPENFLGFVRELYNRLLGKRVVGAK